jgi:hypothetical protein
MMDRWGQVKKYQSEVGQGLTLGSSDKENDRFINSVSGKIIVLKENLKEALTNLISTDAFKGLVDFGISITGIFTNITAGAQKMGMSVPLAIGTLSSLFMTIKSLGTNNQIPNLFSSMTKGIVGFTKGTNQSNVAVTKYSSEMKKLNLKSGEGKFRVAEASKGMLMVGQNASKSVSGLGKFSTSLASIGTGLLSTAGNALLFMGATAAISGAIQLVSNEINKYDKALDEHKNNVEQFNNEINSLESTKGSIANIAGEFDTLNAKTNKSAEEVARLSVLKKEIATLMPDLVIGTDENGDPLLAINGSAESLIDKLDVAIGKKKELMSEDQIDSMNNAIDYFNKPQNVKVGTNQWGGAIKKQVKEYEAYKYMVKNSDREIDEQRKQFSRNLTSQSFFTIGDRMKQAKAEYSAYEKLIDSENKKLSKKIKEDEKFSAEQRKGVNASFLQDNRFKNLTSEAKTAAQELTGAFDFKHLDKDGIGTYIDSVVSSLQKSGGEIPKAVTDFMNLRQSLEKTGDIGSYEKALTSLNPALAKTLGLSQENVKQLTATPEAYKATNSALNQYLKTYGKTVDNISTDQKTSNLAKTFESFHKIGSELRNLDNKITVDGVVKFNPKVIMEDDNTPQQIKDLIGKLQDENGNLDQKGHDLLLRISAAYELGADGEDELAVLQKELDAYLGGKEKSVDIGNIELKGDVAVSPETKAQIQAALKEMDAFEGRDGVKQTIEANVSNVDEIQKYADIIKNLQTTPDLTNKFIIEQIGDLKELKDYKDIEEHLRNNPEIALKYGITIDGDKDLEGMRAIYDTLPPEVQTQINTKVIGTDKLDLIKKLYDEFPENKDLVTSFILNNPDALNSVKDWDALVKLLPPELRSKLTIETEGTEEAKEGKKVVDEAKNNTANQEVKTETKGTEEAKEGKKTVDGAKGNSAKQNVETTSTGKEEAKQNKDTVDSAKGNTAVQTIVTKKEGENPEDVKNQLISTNGATATTYIKLQTEGQEETNKAKQQVDSLSGKTATAQIELMTTGLEKGEKAEQTVKKADGKKAKTSIEVAMEGVDKVNQALQQVEKISGKKIAPLVFNANTAQAAQNITGLINKVKQFQSLPKRFTTTFNASTAQAAKNISGLMRKIDSFKASYTGTISTNFVVNTSYTTSGSPPSSGSNNGGKKKSNAQGFALKTATLDQPIASSMFNKASSISTFADYPEESVAPMMRSGLATFATPVSSMPKANLLAAPRTLSSPLLSRSAFGYKPSIAHDGSSLEKYFKNDIEFLKELEAAIKKVTNAIGLLDTKMKNASASDKSKYLQEQNKLYVEQQRLIKEQIKAEGELQRQKNWLLDNLKKKGFKFDNNTGNMLNYEELLRDKADAMNKAEEKSNKKNAKDADKDKYEKLKKEYDEMKKMADAYFDLEFDKIPKLEQEWEDLNNKRIEAEKEIKKLQEEAWQTSWDAKWVSADKHVKELNNELAMVDILMKNAFGTEKDALIKRKIELLEKQKEEMKDTNKLLDESMQHQKAKLIEFGFKFNNKGDIINYAQQMEHLQQTSGNFEEAKKYAEEYLNLFVDKIPEANKNMADMNNKIKEAYRQQLEITKSVEDEITKMYEKQVEERKKLIDKELKARVDALNKQKEAYNDARKEADYQKDYDKQREAVNKLQKQLDIAKRDTSLSGQKKVKDLLEKLKEEQEKLQDMVQDKIDDDINKMYDKEVDRLEDEAEKNKEDLDERYNKENIQKWVQEALNTGMFTDIDGKVSDLKDSMLDFTDKWGDGLGATGDIIKGELIANLEVARDIMKDMDSMKDKLGLTSDYYNKKTSEDYLKETIDSAKNLADALAGMRVQQNAPLVYVEGNVDKGVMPDLTNAMKKAQEEFANNIVKQMKV